MEIVYFLPCVCVREVLCDLNMTKRKKVTINHRTPQKNVKFFIFQSHGLFVGLNNCMLDTQPWFFQSAPHA